MAPSIVRLSAGSADAMAEPSLRVAEPSLRQLPREDLSEILREAGLPRGFALDWLIDRLEPPAARHPG